MCFHCLHFYKIAVVGGSIVANKMNMIVNHQTSCPQFRTCKHIMKTERERQRERERESERDKEL